MPALGRDIGAPTFLAIIILASLNVALASRPSKRETLAVEHEVVEKPAPPGFVTCFFRSKSVKSYYNYKFEFSVKLRKPRADSSAAIVCGHPASAFSAEPGGLSPFKNQVRDGFFTPKQDGEKYCDCYRGRDVNGRQRRVKYLTVNLTSYNNKQCSASTCWDTYSKVMYSVARQNKKSWETVLHLDDWNLYKADHNAMKALAKPPTVPQLLNPNTVKAATGGRVCSCQRHACKLKKGRENLDNLPGVDPNVHPMAADVENAQDRSPPNADNLAGEDPAVAMMPWLMADDGENEGVDVVDEEDEDLDADNQTDDDLKEPEDAEDIDDADAGDADNVDDDIMEIDSSQVDGDASDDVAGNSDPEDLPTERQATTPSTTTKPAICLTERGIQEQITVLHIQLNVVNNWWTTARVVAAVAAACCLGFLIR